MVTLLAVPIPVQNLPSAHAAAARAAEAGADLIELRLDRFCPPETSIDEVCRLIRDLPLPCIVTCRPVWEGGEYDGDEADRRELLATLARGDGSIAPAYVDLELDAYRDVDNLPPAPGSEAGGDSGGDSGGGLILSSHDFATMPSDLDRRLIEMAEAPACRVAKLAWRARSLRDNLEAFELIRRRVKPTVALCMGEAGLPSRVLAKKFNAFLTFASLDEKTATAPGQPTLQQLKHLYRWDRLTPDTAVYGVIGDPVGHSVSPAFHNAGFDATGFDGVYLPMPIPPEYEHFKATVLSWLDYEPLNFRGASVTIPHKANLLRFVQEQGGEVEPLAAAIGAANTLAKRDDGSLYAGNTDYAALLDATCAAMDISRDGLAGVSVGVLGAGGAARAAVAAFTHHDAGVTVYNRTAAKAEALADAFGAEAVPLDAVGQTEHRVWINTTPIGMWPNVDATPIPPGSQDIFGPGVVVFDTIYNPAQTVLLRDAAAASCVTVPGREMFLRQGMAQFALWTGHAPPRDAFERVLDEAVP
ncbi:MAG: type I 3-dehydroquinate dehydratase [Planctomycetota bacterium]